MVTALVDRITEMLREHEYVAATRCCACYFSRRSMPMDADEWAAHVAERVAAELNLTEEWANSWEQQGDLDEWYPRRTGGGSQEIAKVNMAISRNNTDPRFRNIRLLRRWVSGWSVVEPKPATEEQQ